MGCRGRKRLGAARRDRAGQVSLALADAERSGRLVAELEGVGKRYGERVVVRDFSTRDFGRDRNPDARSVVVPKTKSRQVLERIRRDAPELLAGVDSGLDPAADPVAAVRQALQAEES